MPVVSSVLDLAAGELSGPPYFAIGSGPTLIVLRGFATTHTNPMGLQGAVQRFRAARQFAREAGGAFREALTLNNALVAARLQGHEEEQGWVTRRLQELRR
jgi:hypothetical protein